ncbi:hypothetical protein CXR04_22625 [Streptomyces sp. CMB-StM0423]|nr:hypothetical protein CXR04_22625 [Streptomyces sp. CMB-StM0423]
MKSADGDRRCGGQVRGTVPCRNSAAASPGPGTPSRYGLRCAVSALTYLAGSESAMDAFVTDVPPERAAERLREVAGK